MIRNALLAIGIILPGSSLLRLPGTPLGPGELCIGLWLCLAMARRLIAGRSAPTPAQSFALTRLGTFWVVFAFAMALGAFVGIQIDDRPDVSGMAHDAQAYVPLAALTLFIVMEPNASRNLRHTGWFAIGFGSVWLALQVATGMSWISLLSLDSWDWDRFRGWSANPNQLALYCAVLVPLSLHLATTTPRLSGRILGLLGIVLPVIVGRMTKSDTFALSTLVVCLLLIVLRLRAWLWEAGRQARFRSVAVAMVILASPLLALALAPYALTVAADAKALALEQAKDGGGQGTVDEANLRFALWNQAVRRGLESGVVGLGPGPHLYPPQEYNRPFMLSFEAHNTLLDLFTEGGVLAVGAVLWLLGGIFVLVLRARLDVLTAMVASLAFFSITHFIIRHPIVWFALVLCLVAGFERVRPMLVGNRS